MGIMAIPIPIQVVSHSFPFPILSPIPIPMGISWDSHSHHPMVISTLDRDETDTPLACVTFVANDVADIVKRFYRR